MKTTMVRYQSNHFSTILCKLTANVTNSCHWYYIYRLQ